MTTRSVVDVVVHTHWDRERALPRETTLARLQAVMADAADFAPAQRVGYLPDNFGHVAQMPQVLGQFAIHSQSLHGELRHDTPACVLPDVLGTLRPLKQAHQQIEDRLLGETEPLWAQLTPPGAGSAPAPALQRAWRLLIEQQAHDSICGCSIDEVHAEMAQRFVQLGQQLDALRHAALKLTTADGTELPHQLLRVEEVAKRVSPLDDFPERLPGQRYELAVQASLPGLGALALDVSGDVTAAASDDGWSPCSEIENAAWHVALADDGRLQLTDRRSGRVMRDAIGLLSELDAGDSHNFSPPPQPLQAEARRWWLQGARRSARAQEMQLRISLHLPAGLDAQRQGRHRKSVLCHGELQLRLLEDEPALHARLLWHNAARDQRTRRWRPHSRCVARRCCCAGTAYAGRRRSTSATRWS